MVGIVGPKGPEFGNTADVLFHHPDVREYELPTLAALRAWCCVHPHDSVLYAHTKGVSRPIHKKNLMRKVCGKYIVARWRDHIALLDTHDIIGLIHVQSREGGWQRNYLRGNFWMAHSDYIASLQPVGEYATKFRGSRHRYAAESWPLSGNQCRPYALYQDSELSRLMESVRDGT